MWTCSLCGVQLTTGYARDVDTPSGESFWVTCDRDPRGSPIAIGRAVSPNPGWRRVRAYARRGIWKLGEWITEMSEE